MYQKAAKRKLANESIARTADAKRNAAGKVGRYGAGNSTGSVTRSRTNPGMGFRGPGQPEQKSGQVNFNTNPKYVADYSRKNPKRTPQSEEARVSRAARLRARKQDPIRYYQSEKRNADKRIPKEEEYKKIPEGED